MSTQENGMTFDPTGAAPLKWHAIEQMLDALERLAGSAAQIGLVGERYSFPINEGVTLAGLVRDCCPRLLRVNSVADYLLLRQELLAPLDLVEPLMVDPETNDAFAKGHGARGTQQMTTVCKEHGMASASQSRIKLCLATLPRIAERVRPFTLARMPCRPTALATT